MTDRPLILDYPSSTQAQALQALPDLPIVEALPTNKKKKKERKNDEAEERQQNIQRLATAPLSRTVRAFHNALDMAGLFFSALARSLTLMTT